MKELDFKGLADVLLARAGEFVLAWLPGGKIIGKEYMVGSLRGGPGDSCRVNLQTGAWAEFAGDEKGKDLISLYATTQGIKNGEAAKRLANQINYNLSDTPLRSIVRPKEHQITIPPSDAPTPKMLHPIYGEPSAFWCYRTAEGHPWFYEARYDPPDKGKQFSPWSWSATISQWVMKGYPAPRPLYGLNLLAQRPQAPVMIVEGPKAASAAQAMAGQTYVVVTWPNGASSVGKADWSPLQGRKVLIWPDADEPGRKAAQEIAAILGNRCKEIKQIDVSDKSQGWDAADAMAEGWTWESFKEWAKPRASLIFAAVAQVNGNGQATAILPVQINTSPDETPTESHIEIYRRLGISTTKQGAAIINVDNAVRFLEREPQFIGLTWFDEFHQRNYTKWNSDKVREWQDVDTLKLTACLQRDYGMSKMSDDIIHKAVVLYGHQHQRNEPKDWMESLAWDGTERIERFFIDGFGARDNAYVRSASKNFWISMIARVYSPGCKVDNMVVLEGFQGSFKSTALNMIGKNWYTEAHESVQNKDFFLILQGKLIIEIAELHAFSRAEVTKIKQVITCRTDRYRTPYDRTAQDHPRMSIFVGTTNERAYLKDDTGGRRFWPIKCGIINRDFIGQWRDQLFAEAVSKFKNGMTWYEMPIDLAQQEQEARRQDDEWESIILEYVGSRYEVSMREISVECLKIEVGKMDRSVQMRIGSIMRNAGWQKYQDAEGGEVRKIWRRIADAE